jgi:hypothetical protein
VALLLTAMGGCGGAKKVPDSQAAGAAVMSFSKAFGDGDGRAACDRLTAAARATFVKRVQVLVKTHDCPTAMLRVHQEAGADVNGAFSTARVSGVKVTGSTATATLTATGHSTPVSLAREGGAWKLTGVPGIQ